jgi:hypothetical protein
MNLQLYVWDVPSKDLDSPEWKAFNKYAFEQGYRVKAEPSVKLQFILPEKPSQD